MRAFSDPWPYNEENRLIIVLDFAEKGKWQSAASRRQEEQESGIDGRPERGLGQSPTKRWNASKDCEGKGRRIETGGNGQGMDEKGNHQIGIDAGSPRQRDAAGA